MLVEVLDRIILDDGDTQAAVCICGVLQAGFVKIVDSISYVAQNDGGRSRAWSHARTSASMNQVLESSSQVLGSSGSGEDDGAAHALC